MSIQTIEDLDSIIITIRGQKVVLSTTLAALYEVQPKVLLQAVKRNLPRFPKDFMFQLTQSEFEALRSQIVTLEKGGKGQHLKYLPYAFTQEGIAMLSSVLRSSRAIEVNIAIMRAFVQIRSLLSSNRELSKKITEIEAKMGSQDRKILTLFSTIRQLIEPPELKKKHPIGFRKK
jgi:hypothetical protein